MTTAIHVTHEAIQKLGGIGTVIHGLLTSDVYNERFKNTLLYTPLFHRDGDALARLGEDSEVIYSSVDGIDKMSQKGIFRPIEKKYGVRISYGRKSFYDLKGESVVSKADIVAVDIWDMPEGVVNEFKYKLWESFKIQSDHFKHDRDYEQYLRIGAMVRDVFEALYGAGEQAVVFAHEYMGMASALAFVRDKIDGRRKGDRTIFYAHEVSTARVVVEKHAGHDLSFYNIMNMDRDEGISLEEEFGSFASYSRNELVKSTSHLDYVFAVSDITKDELKYLCPKMDDAKIKVVYNGIPIEKVPYKMKKDSIGLVGDYCEAIYNFRPDYVFTHVARLVISKAFWRDIRVLYHLDEQFARKDLKGFFVVLSTLVASGRPGGSVAKMEMDYGWPVLHREGWPDLMGAEVELYKQLALFNSRSKRIKGVFLNQFGFDNKTCGLRVPEGCSILALRLASDVEFGFSIYEPFGIAQLETLPYGGLPALSSACGSAGLLKKTLRADEYVATDFTKLPSTFVEILKTKDDFKNIGVDVRDQIESEICLETAADIIKRLPKDDEDRKKRFQRMQVESERFDWNHVANNLKADKTLLRKP